MTDISTQAADARRHHDLSGWRMHVDAELATLRADLGAIRAAISELAKRHGGTIAALEARTGAEDDELTELKAREIETLKRIGHMEALLVDLTTEVRRVVRAVEREPGWRVALDGMRTGLSSAVGRVLVALVAVGFLTWWGVALPV